MYFCLKISHEINIHANINEKRVKIKPKPNNTFSSSNVPDVIYFTLTNIYIQDNFIIRIRTFTYKTIL